MKKVVFFAFAALCLLNFAFAEEGSLESLKNAFPGIEFTDVIEIGPVEAGEEVSRRGEKMDAPEITVDPVLATFSAEQQVAIILTKLGMTDALNATGIHIKGLAEKALEEITSDLSEMVIDETITFDGKTEEWKTITVEEKGEKVKYCFRQLENGNWTYKKK